MIKSEKNKTTAEKVFGHYPLGDYPFDLILPELKKEVKEPFANVVGHDIQKNELLNVVTWFKNSAYYKSKGVSLPKAIILYGEPGNGKTFLLKEMVDYVNAPVFLFKGKDSYVDENVSFTFAKAREMGHSIIILDEIDLLLNKERRVIRTLQECLDGVESNDDILVLAATNNIDQIPEALLRVGRFDKIISIPFPTGKEALDLLKKHLKEFNVSIPEDFDEDEAETLLSGATFSSVKGIANDIVLRNGFENITYDMIVDSIFGVTDRIKRDSKEYNYPIAVHESGHALLALRYPEYFKVNRMKISGISGRFHANEVKKDFWPFEKSIADIKIALAGTIAEKIIFGTGSNGAEEDLQKARNQAYHLINLAGYSSCWETLPPISPTSRTETSVKRRRMERKIERLLKKCEKDVNRYLKSHKKEVEILAKELFEKKRLKSSEILSLVG